MRRVAFPRRGTGRSRSHRRDHRQLRRRPPRPPARDRPGPRDRRRPRGRATWSRSPSTRTRWRSCGRTTRRSPSPRSRRALALLGDAGADDVLVRAVLPRDRRLDPRGVHRPRSSSTALHAQAVVVGANFRFGNRAAGDVATLSRCRADAADFTVEGIALDGGPQVWSSTYVRTCLLAGDVEGAAEALGRPYTVTGIVVKGDQRGRELGFPTANVPTRRASPLPPTASTPAGCAASTARRGAPGGDLGRHQPDLRRRARTPGRGLRPGPHRPRALRGRGRDLVRRRGSAGWSRSRASTALVETMKGDVVDAREILGA